MIVSTSLYFEPYWPRWLWHYITRSSTKFTPITTPNTIKRPLRWREWLLLALAAGFLVHQVVVPLRHHFYEGDVEWNEVSSLLQ
jgi:hypothetical protein